MIPHRAYSVRTPRISYRTRRKAAVKNVPRSNRVFLQVFVITASTRQATEEGESLYAVEASA